MQIEEADDVRWLACLALRGGNELAVYSAEMPGLKGWVSCRPLRPSRSGGDLYYLSACSQGAIARIVIADVAGEVTTAPQPGSEGRKPAAPARPCVPASRLQVDLGVAAVGAAGREQGGIPARRNQTENPSATH